MDILPFSGHLDLALPYSVCQEVDLSVIWSMLLKIDRGLQFLKHDRFSSGNVNMAKIYERVMSKNILREKRRDSFDPQGVNPLGEDGICMVNLLVIPQKKVFFYYMIDLLRLFQKRSFVLSSEHK